MGLFWSYRHNEGLQTMQIIPQIKNFDLPAKSCLHTQTSTSCATLRRAKVAFLKKNAYRDSVPHTYKISTEREANSFLMRLPKIALTKQKVRKSYHVLANPFA